MQQTSTEVPCEWMLPFKWQLASQVWSRGLRKPSEHAVQKQGCVHTLGSPLPSRPSPSAALLLGLGLHLQIWWVLLKSYFARSLSQPVHWDVLSLWSQCVPVCHIPSQQSFSSNRTLRSNKLNCCCLHCLFDALETTWTEKRAHHTSLAPHGFIKIIKRTFLIVSHKQYLYFMLSHSTHLADEPSYS